MKSNNINTMKRGSRSVVSTTLATAYIEHSFSIHSAYIGSRWQTGGKLLRIAAMICLLLTIGSGNVWGAVAVVSYNEDTQDTNTAVGSSNISSGSAGRVSWSATSATWNSSKTRWDWASGSSVTFTVSSGYVITEIETYTTSTKGTFSVSPTATITGNGTATCTISGLSASSVTITTSGNHYIKDGYVHVTYEESTPAEPHTVRFYTASGTYTDLTEGSAGAGVTPPSMSTPCDGWAFQGWSTSYSNSTTSTTVLSTVTLTTGKYYPSNDVTLYPVYTKSGGTAFSSYSLVSLGGTITSGKYIVSTGSYSKNNSTANGGGSVSPSTTEQTSYELTITSYSTYFTIQLSGGNYLGATNGTTIQSTANKASDANYQWTYNSNGIYCSNQSRYMRANATSDFRNYKTNNNYSGSTQAKLYKRNETTITYYYSYPACCTDPELAYGTGSVVKTYGASAFTNTLTNSHSVAVTYASSDPTVATVNGLGQVTILKVGSTTITASSIAQTVAAVSYCADEASYTLTVNKANITPTLTYSSTTLTYGGSNSSAPTVGGNTGSGAVSYAVTTATPAGCVSVDPSTGVVTPVAAGSATITATIAATTNYNGNTATANFTVNKADISPTLSYSSTSLYTGDDSSSPTIGGNTGSGTVSYAVTAASPAGCVTVDASTGVVTAVSAGTATITATIAATTNYNGNTATANFTITAASNFTNGETVFIQADSKDYSAWKNDACVKAWFNTSGSGGSAVTTYWLFDATDSDAGKKLFAAVVPSSGLNQVQLQRKSSDCSSWWNSNGDLTKASSGGVNTFRSYGSAENNIAWNGSSTNLYLYGSQNSWASSLGTFTDQGAGVWTASFSNYAPDATSKDYKIKTSYNNGWIGNTNSNNNATLSDMKVGSTYNVTATLDVTDHSLVMSKTFVKGTVSFDLQGHGLAISDYTNVLAGSKIAAPSEPSATGYTFGGWYKEAGCTNAWNFASDVVNETMTLYAKWTKNNYTLTWNLNGGIVTVAGTGAAVDATGSPSSSVAYDDPITVPIVTKTGYTFSSWNTTPATRMPAAHTTYTAQWTANQYNITYKDQGGGAFSGTQTSPPAKHTYGTATTLKIPTKTGYDFGGWFTAMDCSSGAVGNTTAASLGATDYTADITLYAKWTLHNYTISSTLTNVSCEPAIPSTYTYTGSAAGLTYTFTANSGYALPASVTVTGTTYTWNQATGVLTLTGTITSDISITVIALPKVTWMAGGSVFNTQSGTAGTTLTNPGTPSNSTYCDGIKVFVGWTGSEIDGTTDTEPGDLFSSAAATSKTIPAGGTTYYAVFATAGGTPTVYTKVTSVDAGTYVLVSKKTTDTYMYMPNTTSSGSNPSLGSGITMSTTLGVTTLTNDISNDMLWDLTTGETSGYFYVRPHGSSTIGLGTTASTGANIRISSTYVDTEWRFATSNDYGWEIYNGSMYLAVYSDSYWRNYSNNSTNQNGTFYMFKQSGGVTYSAYATTCAECTTAATVGAATLKGDFSLSSVGVTCPTSGTAVGTNCSWLDYGFVWSPSSNTTPTIGGTNCTEVQTGTTGSSNTWDDDLESTFVVGNTYYYRAYGKNGKAESDFVYGTVNSFIPRSVTFNLNGHGESAPSTQYVPDGGKATDPSYSETVTGWAFGGWYKEAGCTNAWTFATDVVSSANKTLYAKWTEKPKYTITLNAGNGTVSADGWTAGVSPTWSKTQANGDEEITLPSASCNCAGWEFQGWAASSVDQAGAPTMTSSGASVLPVSNTTYYAVYRQNATGGTTYNKITSTGDLTTGDYLFVANGGYAMQNTVNGKRMDEVSGFTSSNPSQTTDNTSLVWTIAKFNSQVVIKNGSNYLGIDADNTICMTTTPHFFTYTYNAGSSRWEFTSVTKTSYQLTYSTAAGTSYSYFCAGTSQSTAIYLYKQGDGLTGNYKTNPICSDITVTGAVSPAGSGTVTLTASSGKSGDKVYAMYTPDEDYNFDEWSISGTGSTLGSTTAVVTEITIGSANTTVTANFVAKDWKTVTWKANGVALTGEDLGSASVKVENGFDITALPPVPTSCETGSGMSDQFIGWVVDDQNWSGKTNDLTGITIYKKLSEFPTVTDDVTYHAVWAAIDETTNEWVKVTSVDGLSDGDVVAIIRVDEAYYLPNAESDPAPAVAAVTKTGDDIDFVNAMKFTASYDNESDGFRFESVSSSGKYLWAYNDNKGIYIKATNGSKSGATNIWWLEDYDEENETSTGYGIVLYCNTYVSSNNFRYLATYGTTDWRCYGAVTASNLPANVYVYAYGYKNYMTRCCTDPELAFDGEYNYQTLVRQDIHGAHGGNGSATVEQGKATLVLDYATESDGTCTVEVKKLTGGDNRSTAAAGSSCVNHTGIAINESTKKVTFDVWTYAGSYPTANGQGTYRIKITQDATSTYCAAETYYFVDVTLRDKFVDAVNGNATINVDGQSKTTSDYSKTPTEASLDGDKNDDCHSTTRRFLGWVREDNMDTWYGSSSDRTRDLDDKKDDAALVAPNADIITSGSTWYAIWGIEE